MVRRLSLLSLIFLTACGKPAVPALSRPLPLIIGHRGASGVAPENTLAAFRTAFTQGADGIEGDFHLTRDGEIVCLHDADTQRVAGVPLLVRDCTLAELRGLDVGSWKGKDFRGETIPTLDEVMLVVPSGKRLYVEVKCGPEIAPRLVETLEAGPLDPGQIVIIAFDEEVVRELKSRTATFPVYWLVSIKPDPHGAPMPSAGSSLATLARIGADGLGLSADPAVNAAFVAEIKQAGFRTNVWTIDSPEVARRFRDFGVDSITSNVPGPLRAALASDGQ